MKSQAHTISVSQPSTFRVESVCMVCLFLPLEHYSVFLFENNPPLLFPLTFCFFIFITIPSCYSLKILPQDRVIYSFQIQAPFCGIIWHPCVQPQIGWMLKQHSVNMRESFWQGPRLMEWEMSPDILSKFMSVCLVV